MDSYNMKSLLWMLFIMKLCIPNNKQSTLILRTEQGALVPWRWSRTPLLDVSFSFSTSRFRRPLLVPLLVFLLHAHLAPARPLGTGKMKVNRAVKMPCTQRLVI